MNKFSVIRLYVIKLDMNLARAMCKYIYTWIFVQTYIIEKLHKVFLMRIYEKFYTPALFVCCIKIINIHWSSKI